MLKEFTLSTTVLVLRSAFVRLDWPIEASRALLAHDWPAFIFCLRRDLSLLDQEFLGEYLPLFVAVASGHLDFVETLLQMGADTERTTFKLTLLPDSNRERNSPDFLRPRFAFPYWKTPHFNLLATAHLLGHQEIYDVLLKKVSSSLRNQAVLLAVLLGLEDWALEFDLKAELKWDSQFMGQRHGRTNILVASLLSERSASFIQTLWEHADPELKNEIISLSSTPPGFEEGDFPSFEGRFQDWAQFLKRSDLDPLFEK